VNYHASEPAVLVPLHGRFDGAGFRVVGCLSVLSTPSTTTYIILLSTYSMPRISGNRRVEGDISEYLLEMADIIEMDDVQAFDSDNEILDVINAFFDDLSYLCGL